MTTSASRSRAASHPRLCGHVPTGHSREGTDQRSVAHRPARALNAASAASRAARGVPMPQEVFLSQRPDPRSTSADLVPF